MLQCCGVGGGASTAPQAPQLQDIGSAVGTTTSTNTTIMQDAVLESILEQMRETKTRKAELERQHAEAQNQLREKIAGRYQGPESVEALQSKIRELEKKTELQMVRHEELTLEMTSLRHARSRGPIMCHTTVPTTWPPAGSEIDRIIAKIEQDNSASRLIHELDHSRGTITTQQPSHQQGILRSSSENLPNLGQHQHPPHPHALSLGMPTQMGHYAGSPMPLTPMMPGCPALTPNGPPYHYSEPIPPAPSLSSSQSQPVFQQKIQQYQQAQPSHTDLSTSHSQSALPTSQQKQQQAHSHFTSNQYQESYPHTQTYQQPLQPQQQQQPQQQPQQQQQHPASTSYLTPSSQNVISHYTQPTQTAQTYQLNGSQQATTYPSLSITSHPNGTYNTGAATFTGQLSHHNYSVPQTSIPQTTLSSLPPYSSSSFHSTLGALTSVPQTVLPFSSVQSTYATSGSTYSTVGTNAFGASGVSSGTTSTGLLQAISDPLQAMQQLSAQSQANQLQQQAIIQQIQQSLRASSPTATASAGQLYLGPRQMPKIPSSILSNPLDRLTNDNIVAEGQVDMLDIPGKGRCYVYTARFTYEPFQHSPNENPEAELPVQGGDYLLVWGQPDEDGFLDAETLDGRRGLVPANFVQKLVGDDLLQFHQAVLGLRDVDDSASTNIPQCYLQDIDLELAALEEGNRNRQAELSEYAELDNIAEEDEQEPPVPAPQHLTLERQLNKSVLIGWTPPENTHQLESYHVYVDGVLKVTVKATERTRALVEGVDSTRPHRISVRSVTHSRRTSRDAACTMVIGKDVALGPTAVKASNVTATSAVISWLPSNSNHQHVVCVNNVEVRTVKPGVYRHTITGLAPSTIYRVTVKAKNLRATHFEDQNAQAANNLACHVHFKTLPKGLPDPPVDIQVEAGPQDGTLLVTWQPVALNGSAVTGYAVYADGKKVTDVDSPTGDHALVDIHKLMGLNPKHITVRTKSRESQSGDSCATAIPCSVLRGGATTHLQHGSAHMQDQGQAQSSISGQPDDANRLRMPGASQRYPTASVPASHMRRHATTRLDAHGQVIIETDENLSDKEIYPGQSMSQMGVPDIAKDSASEANYSEEDDPSRRGRGMPLHHGGHQRYGPQMGQQGLAGTHRSGRVAGPGGRPQDPYYDQPGNQRSRAPGYRGSRDMQSQGGTAYPPSSGQQLNKRTRLFVALFKYDPTSMSPNPDACEELAFSNGDTIKVYGDKDADGFYWGECYGRQGFVPCNMVQEIQDPNQLSQAQPGRRSRWGDTYANMPVKKMIALYDYDPHKLSPNVDTQAELRFRTGNEIYVYGDLDDDGFYMGELNGVRGLVPSNYLAEAPDQPPQGQLPPDSRRPPGQSQGPGARGPPPPPREPPPSAHRRGKDACIVPVSVPVCHLDSRQQQQQQQQQQPSLMNNQQHQLQHQQNNPPHLAYQQANHHSYTTVTTSNQHGPTPMGAHQQGPVPPHLQQQGKGRGGAINRVSNVPGGMQGPGQHMQQAQQQQLQQQQQQDYQQQNQSYQQQQSKQQNQSYSQQNQGYQQQGSVFGPQGQQFPQQQQQQPQQQSQQQQQQNQGPSMQAGQGTSKPMRGIPTVLPTAQSKSQPPTGQGQQQQQQPQQQQQSTGPNLMQKFTEMAGASAGGDILSKGKELIFMKFGLGK